MEPHRARSASLTLAVLLLAATPLAWLPPNHYWPWLSAWHEGPALALLLVAALLHRGALRLPKLWSATIGVALATVAAQWLGGVILFDGDAMMAALYLLTFGLAIALGASAGGVDSPTRVDTWLAAFAGLTLAAAIASVAVALVQSAGLPTLGLWTLELPPRRRPFGNLSQPNHLCTAAFLGICAAALLFEMRRIGRSGWWAAAGFLVMGMVVSGSRTGWLQVLLLILAVAWLSRRTGSRLRLSHALGLGALFAAATVLWPMLNAAALLSESAGRLQSGQLQSGGGRELLWPAMVDAILRSPWVGYGWLQMTLAQQAVALDHAPIARHFEYSHNLILDLLIWVGIPAGTLLLALGALAIGRTVRATTDPRAAWLLVGVGGFGVHAMLEFPHAYAHFLVPVGLALGTSHALARGSRHLELPAAVPRAAAAGLLLLFATIVVDYLEAEQNFRTLRLEAARIGVARIETPAPDLRVLDQLQAFLELPRIEARAGLDPEQMEMLRRTSARYAFAPAMFRYATAAAMNGQPAEAAHALAVLCRMHSARSCEDARSSWRRLQGEHPVLTQVPPP